MEERKKKTEQKIGKGNQGNEKGRERESGQSGSKKIY